MKNRECKKTPFIGKFSESGRWCRQYSTVIFLLLLLFTNRGFSQGIDPNPDDARWGDIFKLAGIDYYVDAVEVASNGNIYVGGIFDIVDGIVVNGIAMWDGESWNALGGGVTGGWSERSPIYAIAIDSDKIYVGGDFRMAGDTETNFIAMWDGENWHALGSGMNGVVHALAVDDGNVYAGGYDISEAGGVTVNNIAKWDGENWTALGNGVYNSNAVEAIVAKNDTVYAGGSFMEAGNDTVSFVAFWDGNNWHDMDGGMSGYVNTLEIDNGLLYAGGEFVEAGGDTVNYLAQWDGSEWSHVGGGVNARVFDIVTDNDNLYISGDFQWADTVEVNRLAKWDGREWSNVGRVTDYGVNAITAHNDLVYAAGQFFEIAGKDIKFFAEWDGENWSQVTGIEDNSVDGEVYALAIDGEDVYVGGKFVKAGGDSVNNIARWDGKSWHPLGEGLNDEVLALVIDSGMVYAGGRFSFSGDQRVPGVAKWDGQEWSGFGDGTGPVAAIAFHGQNMYVGGSFNKAGDKWARSIARWDGTEWHALGGDGGLEGSGGVNGVVNSIAVDRDTIYVAGYFGRAYAGDDIVRAKSIVKWDGETWHPIGSFGPYNPVIISSISVNNGIIYAAGSFPRLGGDPAKKVVKWEGTEWLDVGDEMLSDAFYGSTVNTLIELKGRIYLGGTFDLDGEKTGYNIAEWTGKEWLSLGSGVNSPVYALAADSSYLYAGGSFTIAGEKASAYFGRYDISGAVGIRNDRISIIENYALYQNYPNPFNPVTAISYRLPAVSDVVLSVYNVLGQKIATMVSKRQPAGAYIVEWNAGHMASGVYYYQIIAGEYQDVKKMILIK